MSKQYKFGDVIVRCYPNNFNAICIYLDDINGGHMLYLNETFSDNGGLRRFERYLMTRSEKYDWHYRFATFGEANATLKELIELKNIYGNIRTGSDRVQNLDYIIDMINNYKNTMRRDKLYKLKKINEKNELK